MGNGLSVEVATHEAGSRAAAPPVAGSPALARLSGRWAVPGVAGLVVGVPLVVALVALRHPRWYPTLDFAMTELRVRDVFTRHPPLVGLAGRLQADGVQGSHPGPLSFWLLWPVYRLAGASGWGLQVATAVLNTVAVGLALWVCRRRAGLPGLLGLGAGLAVLAHGLGIDRLTEPWNPYLPVLWWVAFLLAAWSVLCDDMAFLLVAVVAGSFCAQTHISYVGSVGGTLALLAGVVVVRAWRGDHAQRRRFAGWAVVSLGALVLLWLPPVVAELRYSPGNITIARATFRDPPEPALGLGGDAFAVWASQLDVGRLPRYVGSFAVEPVGSVAVGAAVLALWAAAAGVAWTRRRTIPELWRLHAVVGVALLLGLVSISRIHGEVFHYLLLGASGTALLAMAATVWSGAALWPVLPARWRPRWATQVAAAVLVATVLASTVALTSDAVDATAPDPVESSLVAHVAPDTIAALRAGLAPGGGPDGRYLVRWADYLSILPAGYGLVLELERAGLDVGAPVSVATSVVLHRVRGDDQVTATVLMVRGERAIARVRAAAPPEVVETAYHEPRTRAEVERYAELRADVVSGLRSAGLEDLVPTVDSRTMSVALATGVPPDVEASVTEMVAIGQPVAVFVGPPGPAWLERIDPRLLVTP